MNTRFHTIPILALAALFVAGLQPAMAQAAQEEGPQVGKWKTWALTSGSEIAVPAPPTETSDQAKAELTELRQLQKERTTIANTAIQYYNAVPATQRWHDAALVLARADKQSLNRQARLLAILHTAMHDAVIATWAAKYAYNRRPPTQLMPDLNLAGLITGAGSAPDPSYPSEHTAIAGAAVGVLTLFFPKEEASLKAIAAEIGQTRLLMGANYRSDVEAGSVLGQQVAQKALARAAADGSDAVWTGAVPTGPGLWTGANPAEPLQGTWKPYLMTRGDQFRPGPPPAFNSAEFLEELALVKRLSSNPTPSQRALAGIYAGLGLDFVWSPIYELARRERPSVPREVRLLSLVATVQFDAYIASHDAKYAYWRMRPSMADPTIQPNIPMPNHPAYVSNAAILASAAGEVVASLYPPYAARFRYLAEEAGLSRIYGGIHYPSDERAGNEMGKKLGALALQRDSLNGN
jgi:membrane-associated phospholipid phosphatase